MTIQDFIKEEDGIGVVEVILILVEKYLSLILYRFCRKNISICLYHIHPINQYVSINKKGVSYV